MDRRKTLQYFLGLNNRMKGLGIIKTIEYNLPLTDTVGKYKHTNRRKKMNKQEIWDSLKDDEKLVSVSLFKEESIDDEYWGIRLEAYRALGFTDKAFDDEHWDIRLEAYRTLGFTKEAFNDEHWETRLEAYRALGFTKAAFDDEYWRIRLGAKKYFKVLEKLGGMDE